MAVEAVDFRKGIDSLAELCRAKLNADPFSGSVFAKIADHVSCVCGHRQAEKSRRTSDPDSRAFRATVALMPAERAKQAIRTQLLILSPQEDEALLEEAGFSGVARSTQASAFRQQNSHEDAPSIRDLTPIF